jgi:hypothetical protein
MLYRTTVFVPVLVVEIKTSDDIWRTGRDTDATVHGHMFVPGFCRTNSTVWKVPLFNKLFLDIEASNENKEKKTNNTVKNP